MEIDKEKLLLSIKKALGEENPTVSALKSGNKQQILNSLPSDAKIQLENMLKNNNNLNDLLNSKEAKDLISKYLKDK